MKDNPPSSVERIPFPKEGIQKVERKSDDHFSPLPFNLFDKKIKRIEQQITKAKAQKHRLLKRLKAHKGPIEV